MENKNTVVTMEEFTSFKDCVRSLKKLTFLIVRGKKGEQGIQWTTLGTGFVASPNRMLTVSHVLDNPAQGERYEHKDGDAYLLIRHDDEFGVHGYQFFPTLEKDMFLHKDADLAVLYLSDDFYAKIGDQPVLKKASEYVRVSKDPLPIGSETGILGYPLCELKFEKNQDGVGDINKPLIGDILLRVDKGVINCRYKIPSGYDMYDFTMSFNPGNSGGPIFDATSGKVVALVHGYIHQPINIKEVALSNEDKKKLQIHQYVAPTFINSLNAVYSKGFAISGLRKILEQHNIELS